MFFGSPITACVYAYETRVDFLLLISLFVSLYDGWFFYPFLTISMITLSLPRAIMPANLDQYQDQYVIYMPDGKVLYHSHDGQDAFDWYKKCPYAG